MGEISSFEKVENMSDHDVIIEQLKADLASAETIITELIPRYMPLFKKFLESIYLDTEFPTNDISQSQFCGLIYLAMQDGRFVGWCRECVENKTLSTAVFTEDQLTKNRLLLLGSVSREFKSCADYLSENEGHEITLGELAAKPTREVLRTRKIGHIKLDKLRKILHEHGLKFADEK